MKLRTGVALPPRQAFAPPRQNSKSQLAKASQRKQLKNLADLRRRFILLPSTPSAVVAIRHDARGCMDLSEDKIATKEGTPPHKRWGSKDFCWLT